MDTILITDSLFISKDHEQKLKDAGFAVERLDKPHASNEELVDAVKGKSAYILGGVERVTEPIINAADKLKVIAVTGADWQGFVPGHEAATKKGIAITSTPGANSNAVAEYTLTLMLMMLRRVLELGSTGDMDFMTTQSLSDVKIGIVGLGRIGQRVVRMLKSLGATDVYYWNRHQKEDLEGELGIEYMPLDKLFEACDVITSHVSSSAGQLFDKDLLAKAKDGVLFINAGSENTFDEDVLFELLSTGKARAAVDYKVEDERFKKLPLSIWFASNENTGFNTRSALKITDGMAVDSVINILKNGTDQYIGNL